MRSISFFFRSVAQSLILVSLFSIATVTRASAQDVAAGGAIFKQKCTACHSIDKKVIGPALKGITDRQSEEWLIKWTKNAPAMIASGDPAAKAIFDEFKPAMMTAFPELSDDDVKNIYAYVKAEGDKPAAAAAAPGGAAGTEGAGASAGGEVSSFMLIGLIAVIIIAFLVILVLNRVIHTLERVMLQKQGGEPEEEKEKRDRLAGLKKLSKNKKFIFLWCFWQ